MDIMGSWLEKWNKVISSEEYKKEKSENINHAKEYILSFQNHALEKPEVKGSYLDDYKMNKQNTDPDILNESNKKMNANVAKAMAKSENPVTKNTIGIDSDSSARSLGRTYSNKDLEELAKLKNILLDLETKLNVLDAKGKNGDAVQNKISRLKTKINKVSDNLNTLDETD